MSGLVSQQYVVGIGTTITFYVIVVFEYEDINM